MALVDSSVESKYTPIAPCRIVDTRIAGGPILPGAPRSFHAIGTTGFAGQGGAGCDIPAAATAVSGSIINVAATGNGYLKVYAYAAATPTSSFLDYLPNLTLRGSGTIPVNTAGTFDFTVAAFGHATQIVVDLTGYYIKPMWVQVNAQGAGVGGGSRFGATRTDLGGTWWFSFDRDVSKCAYNATPIDPSRTVELGPDPQNPNNVRVATRNAASGALVPSGFYLTVTC